MQEQFDHYIFQSSFERFYEANENGMFNFAVAASLTVHLSKEMKINGKIGLGKSLKNDALKTAASMEISEGGTNSWYMGGISENDCECIFISHGDANVS